MTCRGFCIDLAVVCVHTTKLASLLFNILWTRMYTLQPFASLVCLSFTVEIYQLPMACLWLRATSTRTSQQKIIFELTINRHSIQELLFCSLGNLFAVCIRQLLHETVFLTSDQSLAIMKNVKVTHICMSVCACRLLSLASHIPSRLN